MGNRSTPSKACQPCRQKRRKCDLKEPACSQCIRAKVTCSGYRDAFSLRLRNETVTTAEKVQQGKKKTSTASSCAGSSCYSKSKTPSALGDSPSASPTSGPTPSSLSQTESPGTSRSNSPGSCVAVQLQQHVQDQEILDFGDSPLSPPWPVLNLDVGDIALSNFMIAYASHSPFDYLPDFFKTLPGRPSAIEFAISVPGLVLLAQEQRQPRLLRLAYSRYTTLLGTTQAALEDRELAPRDDTLINVLLLALFEALVFRGRHAPANWNAHIQGASALLQMRGVKQFERPIGWQLFLHASHSLRSSCLAQAIPVPPAIGELQSHGSTSAYAEHGNLGLGKFLDDFAALRANVRELSFLELLNTSCRLLKESETMLAFMGRVSGFYSLDDGVDGHDSAVVAPLCTTYGIDIYPDQKVARRWNTIRMLQIFLADVLCIVIDSDTERRLSADELAMYHDRWPALEADVAEKNESARCSIFRSVPYCTYLAENPKQAAKSTIFPLTFIAVSQLASASEKALAREILDHLAESYGLTKAQESVDMLNRANDMEDWYVGPALDH